MINYVYDWLTYERVSFAIVFCDRAYFLYDVAKLTIFFHIEMFIDITTAVPGFSDELIDEKNFNREIKI